MSSNRIALNSPQVQAAMRYHRDGMIDLYLGVILLLAGISMFTDMIWMSGVWVAVFLPLWQSSKATITVPRLTDEEMDGLADTGMRTRLMGMLTLTLIVGVLIFLLLGLSSVPSAIQETLRSLSPFILMASGMGVLAMFGYKLGATRFYAYALGFLLLAVAVYFTALTLPVMLMGLSLMFLAVGSWLLWGFVQSHPKIQSVQ
jgi:hypothetical protein